MENLLEKPVGQIAAANFNTWQVFEKYGIDYYQKGGRTLKEVAEEFKADAAKLAEDLANVQKDYSVEDNDYNNWDLDKLANHIVQNYHRPAEKRIGVIKPVVDKALADHGADHADLAEIKKVFDLIAGGIATHQKKEELMLFPFIRKMVDAKRNNKSFIRPAMTKSAENPVNMLTHEHTMQSEAFKKIVGLTKGYTSPSDLGADFAETLHQMKEMEIVLHKHLHLENNILFPKALAMDKEMK